MVSLRNNVVLTESNDGNGVLLDEKDGTYWQLNRTGFSVLQQLLTGSSEDEIAKTLVQDGTSIDEILRDIHELKTQLLSSGLLVNS